YHGHFGDTLGFKGGNYTYEQNKRTYEAKIELAETAEFEVDEDEDTDKEEDCANAGEKEREEDVEFVKSERWMENYNEWKENRDNWL
ncbi:hypothetical protein NL455_28460, partial [Klebsiella pneumoniae]|nr:hypothetical protein [Klebsiella pneumoniae]